MGKMKRAEMAGAVGEKKFEPRKGGDRLGRDRFKVRFSPFFLYFSFKIALLDCVKNINIYR